MIPLPVEYAIPEDLHQNLRNKFLGLFRSKVLSRNGIIILKGAVSINKHDDGSYLHYNRPTVQSGAGEQLSLLVWIGLPRMSWSPRHR